MERPRFPILLLILAAFVLAIPLQALRADQISDLKKELQQAMAAKDGTAMAQAFQKLGEIGTLPAVKVILTVGINVDQFGFDAEASNQVFSAAKASLIAANDPEAREFIRKQALKAPDYRQKVLLIDVCAGYGTEADIDVIATALQDKNETVLRAGIRAIRTTRAFRGIGALVDLLARLEKVGGLAWQETVDALVDLTGEEFENAKKWKTYWEGVEKEFLENPEQMRGTVEPGSTVARGKEPPKFFGIEVVSKKIVFIMDVSGSMTEKDPPPTSDGVERPGGGGGTTTGRGGGQGGGQGGGPGGGNTKDLPEERMRIRREQKELKKVVELLPSDTIFTIITFSNKFKKLWDKGLLKATPQNKQKALTFIDGFNAEGSTGTETAMRMAFELGEEADTFYLLSDGSPTDEKGNPVGGLTEKILEQVREQNKFRNVTIHTLGFPGANPGFMRQMSEENGPGKFKAIE